MSLPADELTTLAELTFALGQRDEPTLALVECASLAKRQELEAELAARMPEYKFFPLDLTALPPVSSLLHTLEKMLPAPVQAPARPVRWTVHVHGLENSYEMQADGRLTPSGLTAQLNLERELLFRRVPYNLVLWGDGDFFRRLQREAPDFWHWITYRFRFADDAARPVAELPPLPPTRLAGPGNVAARQARIAELKARADQVDLNDPDKLRRLRDRADLLGLLGDEYFGAFDYWEAAVAYNEAIELLTRLGANPDWRAIHWAKLGVSLRELGHYPQALAAMQQGQELASNQTQGVISHELGMTYAEQQDWPAALAHYGHALDWFERNGQEAYKAATYHQIGFTYQQQQQWSLAVENFRKAIRLKQQIGMDDGLESTYNQLGVAYQQQGQWGPALENYELALTWNQRTGSEFGTGGTHFQIGQLYAEQGRFAEAVGHLEQAVAVFKKYGDPFLPYAEAALADAQARLTA